MSFDNAIKAKGMGQMATIDQLIEEERLEPAHQASDRNENPNPQCHPQYRNQRLPPPAAQADTDDDDPRPTRVEPPRSIAPAAGAELESRIDDLERAVAALRERLQGLEDALGGSGS